jgi:hypothetical protein
MSKFSHVKILSCFLFLAATLFLSACAATTPDKQQDDVATEEAYEIESWDGEGMDIPMDGSSMEAWNQSMARVKAHTTPGEYHTLEGAIKYLLLYDLPSEGQISKLAKRLDGLTPVEIVGKVRWRRAPGSKGQEKQTSGSSQTFES